MSGRDRYKLAVHLEIQREEYTGPEVLGQNGPGYWAPTQDRLTVREELALGALDFIGVMGVLGHLHTVVEDVARTQETAGGAS